MGLSLNDNFAKTYRRASDGVINEFTSVDTVHGIADRLTRGCHSAHHLPYTDFLLFFRFIFLFISYFPTHPFLAPGPSRGTSIPLPPLCACLACSGTAFYLTFTTYFV
jgi:hypothetical protein